MPIFPTGTMEAALMILVIGASFEVKTGTYMVLNSNSVGSKPKSYMAVK